MTFDIATGLVTSKLNSVVGDVEKGLGLDENSRGVRACMCAWACACVCVCRVHTYVWRCVCVRACMCDRTSAYKHSIWQTCRQHSCMFNFIHVVGVVYLRLD